MVFLASDRSLGTRGINWQTKYGDRTIDGGKNIGFWINVACQTDLLPLARQPRRRFLLRVVISLSVYFLVSQPNVLSLSLSLSLSLCVSCLQILLYADACFR